MATVDLSGTDSDLERISKERLLALSLPEMRAVREHFAAQARGGRRREAGLGPAPTDVEMEAIAQTWSEHCKHKIFNSTITYLEPGRPPQTIRSLFKTFIRGTTETLDLPWLVSVFHDNAGVVAFDDAIHLVYKVETHNSPSALDPYGGAITGIVGVNRDPFGTGLGADLLANVWGYCFASPFFKGRLPAGMTAESFSLESSDPTCNFDGVRVKTGDGKLWVGNPWPIYTVAGNMRGCISGDSPFQPK